MEVAWRPSRRLVVIAAGLSCAVAATTFVMVSRQHPESPTTLEAGAPTTTASPDGGGALVDSATTSAPASTLPTTTVAPPTTAESTRLSTTTTASPKSLAPTTTAVAASWRDLPVATRVDEGAIYLVSPSGGDLRKLLVDPTLVGGASFSPDGARVLFISADRLEVVDIDGTDRRVVVAEGVAPVEPRWSPDGTSIAFVRRDAGTRRAAVVDLEGGQLRMVAPEVGGVRDVDWGAGAAEVFIAADAGVHAGPRGGGPGRLVHATSSLVALVRWSPAGHRLLFATNGRLWTLHRDSGAVVELGLGGGSTTFEGRWSPDSGRIAVGLGFRFALFDPDGGRELVESPALSPAWSADGRWLVVRRQNGHGGTKETGRTQFDLAVLRPDGAESRVLLADRGDDLPSARDHQWRPQGDVILFSAGSYRPDYNT